MKNIKGFTEVPNLRSTRSEVSLSSFLRMISFPSSHIHCLPSPGVSFTVSPDGLAAVSDRKPHPLMPVIRLLRSYPLFNRGNTLPDPIMHPCLPLNGSKSHPKKCMPGVQHPYTPGPHPDLRIGVIARLALGKDQYGAAIECWETLPYSPTIRRRSMTNLTTS